MLGIASLHPAYRPRFTISVGQQWGKPRCPGQTGQPGTLELPGPVHTTKRHRGDVSWCEQALEIELVVLLEEPFRLIGVDIGH